VKSLDRNSHDPDMPRRLNSTHNRVRFSRSKLPAGHLFYSPVPSMDIDAWMPHDFAAQGQRRGFALSFALVCEPRGSHGLGVIEPPFPRRGRDGLLESSGLTSAIGPLATASQFLRSGMPASGVGPANQRDVSSLLSGLSAIEGTTESQTTPCTGRKGVGAGVGQRAKLEECPHSDRDEGRDCHVPPGNAGTVGLPCVTGRQLNRRDRFGRDRGPTSSDSPDLSLPPKGGAFFLQLYNMQINIPLSQDRGLSPRGIQPSVTTASISLQERTPYVNPN